jgi:secretion/DNA translocation related TadE-like protein
VTSAGAPRPRTLSWAGARARAGRSEEGAAAVLSLALAAALLLVVAVGSLAGDLLATRARAAAAADLAALAAVPLSVRGPEVACRTAALLAADNAGRLVSCDVVAAEAAVVVECRPRNALVRWLVVAAAGHDAIRVSARAGPAPP